MKYNMPHCEKETHITWNAEDKTARISTCDPASIRKLDKLVKECPEEYSLVSEQDWLGNRSCTYKVSAKLISFRKPNTRVVSEENRRLAAERMRNMRKNLSSQNM